MNIEELDNKAVYLSLDIKNEDKYSDDIVKLSIEFAISVLEEMESNILSDLEICKFEAKIQELKTYLDDNR